MTSSLLPFFHPQGVVIIGASTSPEKLGYGVARNLVQSGYQGAIHFVSQRAGTLFDRTLLPSLEAVPDPVDLAILIVPPQATPEAIILCGARGIHAAIIVSAGFREASPEGAALEAQCLEAARQSGVRLLGPNCIGTIDTHLPLDTTFLQPPMPTAGHIGFISHSGAFCAAIIDWARKQGFGFSQLVSLGNQADINETDMLPMLAADEQTSVIVLYMEGVSNGRNFVKIAREVGLQKPIVALKVGRFESSQKAAASHTGALAGSETAFEAAFRKAGILRADTTEQMFDWARALETCPLPRGRKIAVLTNAGGPGVIAADALEVNGLSLAYLSDATTDALRGILPPAASAHNPVDMLASASPEQYAQCLRLLAHDEGVDGLLLILPPPPMFKAEMVAKALVPIIRDSKKPILIALMGSILVEEAAEVFRKAGIPVYPFPERAASALAALVRRADFLAMIDSTGETGGFASHHPITDPAELVSAYGIPTTPIKLARDAEEAAAIARELGFPIVMKIASEDIPHKSDVGGVVLNLESEEQVKIACLQTIRHIQSLMPDARIAGVHMQRQIPQGQEVITGMVRDPLFGPLIMFGSGGVEVEGLKDVAFALAPLTGHEARELLEKTWAGRKLKGFRNIPPADQASVVDVLLKLSRLALENEEIEEIEINPLRVLHHEAVALDVRMKKKGSSLEMG